MAESTPANPADQQGSRPVPDPTVLTTDQLRREIGALRELFTSELTAASDLCLEKFRSVDQQLDLVEKQRVEQKSDTKAAVDAALTAQKEAVKEQTTASATAIAKSEAGTSEQLKQLSVNFTTAINGVLVTLNDLKDRVVKIESVKLGGQESKAAMYAAVSIAAVVVVAALTVVGFIAANQP